MGKSEEMIDNDKEFVSQFMIDKRIIAFYKLVFMPYTGIKVI